MTRPCPPCNASARRPSGVCGNNACKQYRFAVPPENITWHAEKIRVNAPELARLLEAEENVA